MKNLFIVLLLTMSSTAYCNGSWTPEDIRKGLKPDILKDSGKLNSVVDNLQEEINDKYKSEAWEEAEKIIDTTEFAPEEEEIITGYNAAMLKDPAKLSSIIGHVYGVHSTLVAFQEHRVISEEICIPKQLTIDEIMRTLNKFDAYDFPGSNGRGKGFIVTALIESYQCNEDKASEKYKATKAINAIVEYIPEGEIDKAREGILKYVEKISADDYVSGVVNTLCLAEYYGIIDKFCVPELTKGEMKDILNEFDTGDFPETNVGGVELIFGALYENYHR